LHFQPLPIRRPAIGGPPGRGAVDPCPAHSRIISTLTHTKEDIVMGFARTRIGHPQPPHAPDWKFRPSLGVLEDRTVPSATDAAFLTAASAADQFDIVAGTLAAVKGSTPAVRQFGHVLAATHATELRQLQPILAVNGVTNARMSAQETATLHALAGMSGAAFDAQFESVVAAELQQEISLDQTEISGGSSTTAVGYAKAQMAVDQRELTTVQNLQSGTGTGTGTPTPTRPVLPHHGVFVGIHMPTGTTQPPGGIMT
jgi:predicted outer membrane protein